MNKHCRRTACQSSEYAITDSGTIAGVLSVRLCSQCAEDAFEALPKLPEWDRFATARRAHEALAILYTGAGDVPNYMSKLTDAACVLQVTADELITAVLRWLREPGDGGQAP